jgi:glycosyltransferase involved in cell wall biosynthesis
MNHVALVIPGLDRLGGAERQTILLAKGMRRRGWRVSVVALSGTGAAATDELREAGVGFRSLKMRKGLADPRGWIRFCFWLRRERPHVVHAHLAHAAWLARWSRLGARVPVQLDTLHSTWTGTAGRQAGYRMSGWLPDCVTAVSQAVADTHCASGMVERARVAVIPNGVDVNQWRPNERSRAALRSRYGLTNEFLWLAAGRLEPVKDYPALLRAFAGLPETARLAVAGGGAAIGELLALAGRLGVQRRVRFLGFVPDVERWMQAADGFVLSSRWEGLPMALIEAAACGLPAVATDTDGARGVVTEGQTAFLAPVGDAEGLAAAMNGLMQLPEQKRKEIGECARRDAVERFSLGAVLDHWEGLYGKLLESSGPSFLGGRRAFFHRYADGGYVADALAEGRGDDLAEL